MKRVSGLFQQVASFPSLLAAYKKARAGTRKTERICRFGFHLERELLQLREELLTGSYRPAPYRYFIVRDPKRRTIAVADFRDRVVHHAVVGVLEPIFERCFIFDSYATRKGKGAHAAVFQAQRYLRRNSWFLKSDIEKYFDSIQQDILLAQLARKIKDRPLLDLVAKILSNGGQDGRGLPIGNLTSQFFANVYLNGLDHWIKETLKVRHYIRYMDDWVIFHRDKTKLKDLQNAIQGFVEEKLQLRLKPGATYINRRDNGLSFLGTRIFPALIRMHPKNARRADRKLSRKERQWKEGVLSDAAFFQTLNSYQSYFSVYGTHSLRKKIMLEDTGQRLSRL